jgi:hypothetical protein
VVVEVVTLVEQAALALVAQVMPLVVTQELLTAALVVAVARPVVAQALLVS